VLAGKVQVPSLRDFLDFRDYGSLVAFDYGMDCVYHRLVAVSDLEDAFKVAGVGKFECHGFIEG